MPACSNTAGTPSNSSRGAGTSALSAVHSRKPHDRHTASGDAFLTAQVFLRLLRLAARHGRTTLARISEPFVNDPE